MVYMFFNIFLALTSLPHILALKPGSNRTTVAPTGEGNENLCSVRVKRCPKRVKPQDVEKHGETGLNGACGLSFKFSE